VKPRYLTVEEYLPAGLHAYQNSITVSEQLRKVTTKLDYFRH
jgi:hypothetical protein